MVDWLDEMEGHEVAVIPCFYAGREVFVTGGTGFLGKVLLERLLWTCRDVCRVHMLVRHKRGQTPTQRLHLLKLDQVFDNIRAECPEQLDKLCAHSGDISLPRLGLDDAALEQLKHVSVVFHNAANVKFLENLPSVLQQNVYSIVELLDICDQLPKMEAFVHVSTAYTNAEHEHIEETVLPSPISLNKVRSIVDSLPQEILHEITPRLISPKINAYLFSKCLAENVLVERTNRHYAIAICRPSIVVSSLRYPYPGWVEGLAGATGSVAGTGAGVLHVTNTNRNKHTDFVPVDISADITIAVAWDIVTDKAEEVRVYNISSEENPLKWGRFLKCGVQATRTYAFEDVLYYPFIIGMKYKIEFEFVQWLLQTVPLCIADKVSALCRRKPKTSFSTISHRLRKMNDVLGYFSTHEWRFSTDNVKRLRDRLTQADRLIYNVDITTVNWKEHVVDFVRGIRKYVLKQSEDTLPQARKRMARLRCIHYGILVTLFALVCRLLWTIMPFTKGCLQSTTIVLAAIQHRLAVMKSQAAHKWLSCVM